MIGNATMAAVPRPLQSEGTCAALITKGMRKLIGMTKCASCGASCKIVNNTGRPVVVRSKYKDVWEGEKWRLAEGAEMLVPPRFLRSGEPYCRLAACIEDGAQLHPPASFSQKSLSLYIGSHHLLTCNHEISLTLSPLPLYGMQLSIH